MVSVTILLRFIRFKLNLHAAEAGGVSLSFHTVSNAGGCERSLTEALSVFIRIDERLNHFSINVVAVELIEFIEPEVEAGEVQVRGGVGVAA